MKKKGLLLTGGLVLVAVTLAVGSYVFNDKVEEAAIEATEGKPASDSEKNADVGEVALTDDEKAAVAEEEQGEGESAGNGSAESTIPSSLSDIVIFRGSHQGSYLFSSLTNSVVYAADKYNGNN
ncbi:hypothetical protein B4N84_03625, partial [Flavobacterium sp. IR1]